MNVRLVWRLISVSANSTSAFPNESSSSGITTDLMPGEYAWRIREWTLRALAQHTEDAKENPAVFSSQRVNGRCTHLWGVSPFQFRSKKRRDSYSLTSLAVTARWTKPVTPKRPQVRIPDLPVIFVVDDHSLSLGRLPQLAYCNLMWFYSTQSFRVVFAAPPLYSGP